MEGGIRFERMGFIPHSWLGEEYKRCVYTRRRKDRSCLDESMDRVGSEE